MNGKMKKIIKKPAAILAVIMAVSFMMSALTGCGKKPPAGDPPKFEVTDVVLLRHGYSEYKIVLPKDGGSLLETYAGEFNFFFEQATGSRLPVISDEGLSYSNTAKYISLGDTSLLRASGIEVPDGLGVGGYYIKTLGNTLFLTGRTEGRSEGTLYAVYELLEGLLNYRCYAADVWRLNTGVTELNLLKYDLKVVPSIPQRTLGFASAINDEYYMMRMRAEQYCDSRTWFTTGHSQTQLVNPTELTGPEYADWFVGSGHDATLNYQSIPMRNYMAEEVKRYISGNSAAKVVMLGQADNFTCGGLVGTNPAAGREKYMNGGGEQIEFLNYIAEYLEPWLHENFPGREIIYMMFAYHYSEAAPAEFNAETGKYEPYVAPDGNCYVKPRDDVGIYWAPIGMDYAKSITNPALAGIAENVRAWRDILAPGNFYHWAYCANVADYFINLPNFGSMADNYRFYAEVGLDFIFEQGPVDSVTATFEELRIFLHASLMWDANQDPVKLTKEFFEHYYREAAPAVQEYYDTLRSWHQHLLEAWPSAFNGNIYFHIWASEFWPKPIMDNFQRIFDSGCAMIAPLAATDPVQYQKLTNRIKRLNMTVWYINFKYYKTYFTNAAYNAMIDEFEHYTIVWNMIQGAEGQWLGDLIQSWRDGV
ncbi:MAG: DUF4838 domain-containing protein [Firmicutes bacterium]|nr:DUF4838 domain-containing protein [Bacillota bacterium]